MFQPQEHKERQHHTAYHDQEQSEPGRDGQRQSDSSQERHPGGDTDRAFRHQNQHQGRKQRSQPLFEVESASLSLHSRDSSRSRQLISLTVTVSVEWHQMFLQNRVCWCSTLLSNGIRSNRQELKSFLHSVRKMFYCLNRLSDKALRLQGAETQTAIL